ncbi:hypothetical protein BYZ73_20180 [Rhodovulum viride]|nr:Tox-REase-5 domain-containing protein [Rhodovulum viride]RAP39507.1 hypothetical protein BYZ73_20180 [Rhodovulum viride]
MGFCIPVSIDDVHVGPDGSVIVTGKQICWGDDVPAPPVPVPAPGSGGAPGTAPAPATISPDQSSTRTGTQTEADARTREDSCTENCPLCSPRKEGGPYMRYFGQVKAGAQRGYAYQHFICPWHAYVPESNMIEEWAWGGVNFDGLSPAECHLWEAKHGYDNFLVQRDWSADGGPELADWAVRAGVAQTVFEPMIREARRQHMLVSQHYGKVELTWVFSNMTTRLYVGALLLQRVTGWYHDMQVRPFGGS